MVTASGHAECMTTGKLCHFHRAIFHRSFRANLPRRVSSGWHELVIQPQPSNLKECHAFDQLKNPLRAPLIAHYREINVKQTINNGCNVASHCTLHTVLQDIAGSVLLSVAVQ
eukprot:365469-Chlamydomonas_euryale.AAC.17